MQEEIRRWLNPRSAGARMAVLYVAVTILFYATIKWSKGYLLLTPVEVLRNLKLYQLGTYIFISDPSPLSVIFAVLILVSMGATLESYWGARKLWLFTVATAVVSGIFTVLLSLVVPNLASVPFVGGPLVTTEVWVAGGLVIGRGRTNFWGISTSGDGLALIGAAFIVLFGLMSSWLLMVPSLFALVLTFLYVRLGFPARAFERIGSWRLKRRLAKRTGQLRVVSEGQRNTSGGSDKFLH